MQRRRAQTAAMIATPFAQVPAPPLALLAAAASVAALTPSADAAAILCGLALAASLVAAIEGRPSAMLAATGVSIGLAPGGLILAPLMLGLAIRRRAACRLAVIPLAAAATWTATGGWTRAATLPSLYELALARVDLGALILAVGVGFAAWTAAAASARGGRSGSNARRGRRDGDCARRVRPDRDGDTGASPARRDRDAAA